MEYYIAVDLGATKTRIALCTRDGLIERTVYGTPRTGDENTIPNKIIEVIRNKWKGFLDKVEAIGIATIGPLDITQGKVIYAPNVPIHTFELLRPLVNEFRKPVYVANDCVASAWGEKLYGDAQGVDNFIYLTLSTGIGAGVIVDGHLLIGKIGNAHEIGHFVVDFDSDLRCGCGGIGHWESYAAGANLPQLAKYIIRKETIESELTVKILSGEEINSKTIFEYYRRKDLLAMRVVELFIKASAAGIASMINAYDPELITIGGSVFLYNVDILLEPIIRLTEKNVVTKMPVIKPTRLGDDVGLYGGLAIAVETPTKLREIQKPLIEKIISEV